jgi:hypothetical protein
MNNLDVLHARAKALGLHGLLAHWHDATAAGWLHDLIEWEEQERARRSLERRLKDAHIGRFKPLCDFDWAWPKKCDKPAIEALMSLEFLNDATNAILVGPTESANRPWRKILPTKPSFTVTPCCLPPQVNCWATLPHSIAIQPCGGGYDTTSTQHSW